LRTHSRRVSSCRPVRVVLGPLSLSPLRALSASKTGLPFASSVLLPANSVVSCPFGRCRPTITPLLTARSCPSQSSRPVPFQSRYPYTARSTNFLTRVLAHVNMKRSGLDRGAVVNICSSCGSEEHIRIHRLHMPVGSTRNGQRSSDCACKYRALTGFLAVLKNPSLTPTPRLINPRPSLCVSPALCFASGLPAPPTHQKQGDRPVCCSATFFSPCV